MIQLMASVISCGQVISHMHMELAYLVCVMQVMVRVRVSHVLLSLRVAEPDVFSSRTYLVVCMY